MAPSGGVTGTGDWKTDVQVGPTLQAMPGSPPSCSSSCPWHYRGGMRSPWAPTGKGKGGHLTPPPLEDWKFTNKCTKTRVQQHTTFKKNSPAAGCPPSNSLTHPGKNPAGAHGGLISKHVHRQLARCNLSPSQPATSP